MDEIKSLGGARSKRLSKRIEERSCRFQIGGLEPFGEAVVDRLEERHALRGTALIAPEPGEARGGAQFPGKGALLARPGERLSEAILSRRRGCGFTLQQQKLTLYAEQLRNCPAFLTALGVRDHLLDRSEPFGDLSGTAQGFRPSSRALSPSVSLAKSIPTCWSRRMLAMAFGSARSPPGVTG
jgi:hypothetical protein